MPVTINDRSYVGGVKRNDIDVLPTNVLPDILLSPVGQRKDSNALSLVDSRVEQLPHLRALVLRVPRVILVPERENPLLRTRLLLITSSATERNRESVFVQSLLQGCGFHNVGICGTMVEGVNSLLNSLFI
ncbi:hypothetical protein D3C74_381460 [compost metagenome]